jgi:hypothetical protein
MKAILLILLILGNNPLFAITDSLPQKAVQITISADKISETEYLLKVEFILSEDNWMIFSPLKKEEKRTISVGKKCPYITTAVHIEGLSKHCKWNTDWIERENLDCGLTDTFEHHIDLCCLARKRSTLERKVTKKHSFPVIIKGWIDYMPCKRIQTTMICYQKSWDFEIELK